MPTLRQAIVAAALAVSACADDGSREPGTELGACLQEQFCESSLQCVDGICVSPDQVGDTGDVDPEDDDTPGGTSTSGNTSSPGSTTSAGTSSTSDTGDPGESGGATVYCTPPGEADGCICGHTADYGPPDAACSQSTVGSPSHCCATEGWPAYGGCSCWALSCRVLTFGTCYCGIGLPDAEDEPVGSCSTTGGICCLDDTGGTCSCWDDVTACLEGSTPVSSCSVESLHCGDSSPVSACN